MEGLTNEIKPIESENRNLNRPITEELNTPLGKEIPNEDDVKEREHNSGWTNDVETPPEELDKPLMENESLSPEQKEVIKEKTGWSDRTVDHIHDPFVWKTVCILTHRECSTFQHHVIFIGIKIISQIGIFIHRYACYPIGPESPVMEHEA